MLFTEALQFASRKHMSQRRKNGDIPYINHPIEVANILAQAGIQDYNVLCAAILHDTVEDTDTSPEELEKEFGAKIKGIVMECSDDKSLSKWERKRQQISHVQHASLEAKLVKIADKLSNNWDMAKKPPSSWTPQRVSGYHLWSYAVCKHMLGLNPMLDKHMEELFVEKGVWGMEGEELESRLQEYSKTF